MIALSALLTAASTVVVGLVGAGQLEANGLFDASLIWLALGAVVSPLVREIGAAHELTVERAVRGPLALSFKRLHEETKIPFEELGLHAYFVRGWWPFRHLVCVGRLRLATRNPSGVRWTRGKGVIGEAWARREFTFAIVKGISPGTLNLRQRDLDRVKDYEVIAASHISKEGKVIGCVAVDVPTSFVENLILEDSKREAVKAELGQLGASIAPFR